MTAAPLYLHRLDVDLAEIARQSAERGWTTRKDRRGREADATFDEGAALHHLLTELFGRTALQPFRLMVAPRARSGRVYAYSARSGEDLLEQARATAMPETERAIAWPRIDTREMPETWAVGRRLGFDLRVRPVRRIRGALQDPVRGISYAAGAEIDAFRLEALRRFPDAAHQRDGDGWIDAGMKAANRTREAVYGEWLAERLGGAAKLETDVRLVRFERRRAVRGERASEGPDAVLQGDLEVRNSEQFAELVASGVGRHRAYGFGMLLLRPPNMRPPEG